jgi:hypothetical protein
LGAGHCASQNIAGERPDSKTASPPAILQCHGEASSMRIGVVDECDLNEGTRWGIVTY